MPYKDYMASNTSTKNQPSLGKKAVGLTRRAYWQLLWECYAPVLALGMLFICLFFIGAAAGFWQRIGDPWRLIGLVIATGFMVRSIRNARAKLKPTQSQAQRRVEHDSGLAHRPLDTLADTAARLSDDPLAWRAHVRNAQNSIKNASRPKLRPTLALIDKYYLRFIAPCALILAVMVGAGDNYERFRSGLMPVWQSGISAKTARYEAWIDPPEYTGRPPSYFKGSQELSAPEGSEFVARISGVKTAPRLIVREKGRTRRITAKRLGPKSFEARASLSVDAVASYRIGESIQSWGLKVETDRPPTIEFEDEPEAGKRDKLIFSYNLNDDFGVEKLALVVALEENPIATENIDVSLPGSSVREASLEPASLDLTKHKWAGKQVIGYLVATDGKQQTGQSETVIFVIPDKIFVEPLAKAVAEQRQLMLAGTAAYKPLNLENRATYADPDDKPLFAVDRPDETLLRAPEDVQRTAILIEAVTDRPVGIFEDPTVYMGLRHVYGRLKRASDQADLLGIPEDLWAIALRAEFGVLGDALADMQAAERALNNAMARRAPQREIDALFERYNNAVDRYMEELTLKAIEEAKKRAGEQNEAGGGGGADFNQDEIQALLDAIEEANRMGDTVAARKALAQLALLLENMQIQLAQGGGGSGDGVGEGMSEELQEALEELNDLLGEQRQLRDETQEAGREQNDREQQGEGQQPGQGMPGQGEAGGNGKSAEQLAEEQQQLQELLEKLEGGAGKEAIDKAGPGKGEGEGEEDGEGGGSGDETGEGRGGSGVDIQQALRNARRAMEESENALENSEFYAAGRAQSDAIDALRELGEGLVAEEAKRLQRDADGENGQGGGDGDPFGRDQGGNGVGDVEVPEIDDRQRARDLLEKLRKRSGEQGRDKNELDYLERLLERF
jgi:hypothetical protein